LKGRILKMKRLTEYTGTNQTGIIFEINNEKYGALIVTVKYNKDNSTDIFLGNKYIGYTNTPIYRIEEDILDIENNLEKYIKEE
jgi:hypothetical protein